MGNPDGGWYDETPPRVIGATPADRATNVTSQKVRILFDEFIKIDNPTEKVIVSPPQLEMPEIKAAGKRIEVELKDSLKPNITYTIDFSDAITDNNEGNPLGNYTYSFSTGSEIDTMEVSGYVLDAENLEPIKGIQVGLYPADAPDSIFRTQALLRISRTDSRGYFVIKGIAPGSYRAFALQDADGDYTFSQKSEKIGFSRDVFTPSSKPDTRYDTIWQDTLHIERIVPIPYIHYMPDDIVLRAFTERQTDRMLIKTERKDPDRLAFYFTYGHDEVPVLRGLNFNSDGAFLIDRAWNEHAAPGKTSSSKSGDQTALNADTITYWLRDTALINQDTLLVEAQYYITDTLGQLVSYTDTLSMVSKVPYAKRQKQQQKAYDDWKKQQDKRKKRGEPYDSIMPIEPMKLTFEVPAQLDPDKNITLKSTFPFQKVDTSMIHLYTKVDTTWYQARYELSPVNSLTMRLRGEWRPNQEYSLEVDSAAISDLYGAVNKVYKQGFKVKGYDAYGTLFVTLTGMKGQHVVAELLNGSDAVVKQTATDNGNAEFFYVNPGKYFLRMFVDHNGNGVWDTGDYDADLQPEEVYYYPEEIECKAKWDITETWNPTSLPLYQQKPGKLVKQKADKQKTIRSKNAERAKQLGIKLPTEE